MDQEEYLRVTSIWRIGLRGLKKLLTELTSIKSLFLAFLCVAMAYGWIGDLAGIVGGLAILGVKEVPEEVFTSIIQRMIPGGSK